MNRKFIKEPFKFFVSGVLLLAFLAAEIRGQVQNSKKEALEGVKVIIEGEDLHNEVVTDQDGVFSFNIIRGDIYFINFIKSGYESKTITIDFSFGEDRELTVSLKESRSLSDYQLKKRALSSTSGNWNSFTQLIKEIINAWGSGNEFIGFPVKNQIFGFPYFSSPYRSPLILWGSSFSTNPLVGIYIDGMPQFQSYNYSLNFGNIETIEILRGPQLTLYGLSSTVGIVDIKTKLPSNRLGVATSGEWVSGSYDNFGGQSYDLSISTPLVKNKAYLKGGGFFHKKDGIFYNDTLKKFTDVALNFNVFLRVDLFFSKVSLFTQSKYERLREGAFTYNLSEDEALSRPYFLNHNFDNFFKKDIFDNTFRLNLSHFPFDITSVWNYQYLKEGLGIDTDFSAVADKFLKIKKDSHLFTKETKFISSEMGSKNFKWSVGNYIYFQKQNMGTESRGNSGLSYSTELGIDKITFGVALFGNITYLILDNLHFIFGIRGDYYYNRIKVDEKSTNLSGNTTKEPQRKEKEHSFFFSPKATINFYFDEHNLLYFLAGRGYKSGGINIFTFQSDHLVYQPENTWNTEFGFKSGFVSEYDGSLSANLFYTYWSDTQVNLFLGETDNEFDFGVVNAKKSHSLGLELELNLPIIWGFSVGGGYGFYHSVFLDFTTPPGIQVKGNSHPLTPQHTGFTFFQHQYDFEVLSQRDALINRFDFKYISKVFYNPENTLTQDDRHFFSYTLSFRINGIMASFWIKNILDIRYFDIVLPLDGGQIFPKLGEPRTFGGKISFVF